jgi:hypothetical protein
MVLSHFPAVTECFEYMLSNEDGAMHDVILNGAVWLHLERSHTLYMYMMFKIHMANIVHEAMQLQKKNCKLEYIEIIKHSSSK